MATNAMLAAAVAAYREARYVTAFDRFAVLLRVAPGTTAGWSGLIAAARAADRRNEGRALAVAAYNADRSLSPALRALLELISDDADHGISSPVVPPAERWPVSVITCSNDDTRFAAMAASYARALADWPHEIVRIADAASLSEGYNRAAAVAEGEVFIFSHDDVEILARDFGQRLARRLAECDVLGVAGATRATGPAWPWAGWPHLHGLVTYPHGTGYRVTAYSLAVPIAHGIRVMDGVLLAMRREVALKIGWDAGTCDGFHGYDVDFTLCAAKAGYRLAVASDLGVVHASGGNFEDPRWEATAQRLVAKHPDLDGECANVTGPVACRVADAVRVMALIDSWARMGA